MNVKNRNPVADTILRTCISLALLLSGCAEPQGFRPPEDGLEAAREFIRATLDGDYGRAEMYLARDEQDQELFTRWREHMRRQPERERLGLKSSTILIESVETPNDTTTIVHYSNSFHREPTRMVVARRNGAWVVQFRETMTGRGAAGGDSLR
jgi:hypothetical protein